MDFKNFVKKIKAKTLGAPCPKPDCNGKIVLLSEHPCHRGGQMMEREYKCSNEDCSWYRKLKGQEIPTGIL